MAESKTIFIVFVICLLCTLLVSVSGSQAIGSCRTSKDCDSTELTKTMLCKKDRDCPSSSKCPKDFYYSCLHGECTCIAV
ncbi:defensin-like protein 291 [Raphanus sativus]|uniref:Defensin-like protein 291 n=1 Tax=Raphanus sativus TaxID=3726 RepID=A0A9W3DE23_RAPSA|nr:defensin-like protein 291 [Raphanus sativus]